MKTTSLDPCLTLRGTYFYSTGHSPWTATNETRLSMLLDSGHPPEFRTILAIQNVDVDTFLETNTWHAARYSGAFYADFDAGDDLPFVCNQFKKFLEKLENELDFDLRQARLFASGSKGFHIEVPQECFMPRSSHDGIPWLPYIYREMAQRQIVDTLDLNVYSAKRGRMWRVPNRERSNGKFKVPLTVEEAVSITPSSYQELVSTARPFPSLEAANYNSKFGLLFATCNDSVQKKTSRKGSMTRVSNELRTRFKGKLPPSLETVARGEIPSPVGFNKLAVQLCVSAHSAGMSESEFINTCHGLCRSHQSDSSRYNTPQKREAELRRLFAYFAENPYEFSVAGVRSVLPRGMRTNDLRGL